MFITSQKIPLQKHLCYYWTKQLVSLGQPNYCTLGFSTSIYPPPQPSSTFCPGGSCCWDLKRPYSCHSGTQAQKSLELQQWACEFLLSLWALFLLGLHHRTNQFQKEWFSMQACAPVTPVSLCFLAKLFQICFSNVCSVASILLFFLLRLAQQPRGNKILTARTTLASVSYQYLRLKDFDEY